MRIRAGGQKRARIEIIPLIDVTFLLLVFFIYLSLSMTIQRGIPVRLPEAESARIERTETLTVSVDGDGRIFLEGSRVAPGMLAELLRRKADAQGIERVSVRGDEEARYALIMSVLEGVRQAGIERVSLEARQEP